MDNKISARELIIIPQFMITLKRSSYSDFFYEKKIEDRHHKKIELKTIIFSVRYKIKKKKFINFLK